MKLITANFYENISDGKSLVKFYANWCGPCKAYGPTFDGLKKKYSKCEFLKIDIDEWVKRTGGMSLSHLKEVVVSVIVMGRTFEETMSSLEELKKAPKVKETKKMGFGS